MSTHEQPTTALYTHAFNLIPGIGPQKLFLMTRSFPSLEDAWHADLDALVQHGLPPAAADTIIRTREKIDPITEWQKMCDHDITMIMHNDDAFPSKLTTLPHRPFALYVRGDPSILSSPSIAIVGTRKPSNYARAVIARIGGDIARAQIVITSGLALGTDALSHHAAIDHRGKTIAVLAGGIDDPTIAPRSHLSLAHKIIADGGALISEYPNGTEPNRGTFPARNRIMAGITDATLIIEATARSGTLITAQYAQSYKRPLFALPGSILSENTYGPHTLIQNGIAQLLHTSDDLLMLFDVPRDASDNQNDPIVFSDPLHADLYEIILHHTDGIQINLLIKKSQRKTTDVSSALTMMELDGIISNIGHQTYIVTQRKIL